MINLLYQKNVFRLRYFFSLSMRIQNVRDDQFINENKKKVLCVIELLYKWIKIFNLNFIMIRHLLLTLHVISPSVCDAFLMFGLR